MSKFKRAILTDLQTTYEYLLDNFEDLALETLAAVSDIAGQMAVAAEDLHKDFEEDVSKVRQAATKTKISQGKQAALVKDLKKGVEEWTKRHRDQKTILQDARTAEEEAEQLFREYEMKEDEAIQALGDQGNLLKRVVNGMTSKIYGGRLFGHNERTKEEKL